MSKLSTNPTDDIKCIKKAAREARKLSNFIKRVGRWIRKLSKLSK